MQEQQEPIRTEILELKARCLSSQLFFTQIFYEKRTGRKFMMTTPTGRESHYISICRALTKVFNGETKRLIINLPPRYGKTEIAMNFVAWTLAHYPDCNYLYISVTKELSMVATTTIRDIVTLPDFKNLFDFRLREDSMAKDCFTTGRGGTVEAIGAEGTIVGKGAGIRNAGRYGGAIIIDDIIKPDEALSDAIRERTNSWYGSTLQSRRNQRTDPFETPIIYIGQRVHEDDLVPHLLEQGNWEILTIPVEDEAGNLLAENIDDRKQIDILKRFYPYVYAAQYQQTPIPPGGAAYKTDMFHTLANEPKIISTFITVDTAETDKSYNDATVFSFWGLYRVLNDFVETNIHALHWIDCEEIRVEPKDLEDAFRNFYASCMRHSVKPGVIGIEKKSTGVTLISLLKRYQGLQVFEIQRDKTSKGMRFLEAQPYIAKGLITFPQYAKHVDMCVRHMTRITFNCAHKHDDIADTAVDAVKLALIDKIIPTFEVKEYQVKESAAINDLQKYHINVQQERRRLLW